MFDADLIKHSSEVRGRVSHENGKCHSGLYVSKCNNHDAITQRGQHLREQHLRFTGLETVINSVFVSLVPD